VGCVGSPPWSTWHHAPSSRWSMRSRLAAR
jgi:hypothetical protein